MDCVAYFTQSHIQTDKEIEMKVGCTLPQSGALASPENLVRVAKRAEELGYESVWVFERLLWPTNPRDPYPPSRDGRMPPSISPHLKIMSTLDVIQEVRHSAIKHSSPFIPRVLRNQTVSRFILSI
jgi:hypothetical protein